MNGSEAGTPLGEAEWMKRFQQRVVSRRVPISGMLELTSRCNLRCVHCYLGSQQEQWEKRSQELTTERWMSVIDEIAAAGCLYLSITGGDPMVRRDLPDIYRHARSRGLLVTVLCDGILVSERIIALFKDYPPVAVEVSLYGATRETYEAITRVPGSYTKCLKGIRRLVEAGIRVKLKTVLMTVNSHEVEAMRRMAADLDLPFRIDSAIFPCLPNNDHTPLNLRVSPEEAVCRELADPELADEWVRYLDRTAAAEPAEGLYRCGAGVTGFFIDPFGNASPCLMTRQYRRSLADRSFESLWAGELAQLQAKKPREGYACNGCEKQRACGGCPAFNLQETGAEDVVSQYVCETTQLRWARLEERRGRQPKVLRVLGMNRPDGLPARRQPVEQGDER
jgi:radical SAM protein with 4Fe4S-binding SPASM domain